MNTRLLALKALSGFQTLTGLLSRIFLPGFIEVANVKRMQGFYITCSCEVMFPGMSVTFITILFPVMFSF